VDEAEGIAHLHVHLASQAASVGLFVRTVFGFGYSMTVHGPDEFYDAGRQMLAEKIRAADLLCCISAFTRSQLMMLSPYEQWSKFVVSRWGWMRRSSRRGWSGQRRRSLRSCAWDD